MAEIQAVGDFNLSKAEIITSSGLKLDISSSIINITFFEDILKQNDEFQVTVFKGMRK